jgi:VWFA-related protein
MHGFPMPAKPSLMCSMACVVLSVVVVAGRPPDAGLHSNGLEPIVRTVYVTVTDGQGVAVPDLTPADFTIKEGGKEREILKAAPATTRMRLAVMVEERLLGDGSVRMGLFEFMKRLQPVAETALITIGLRNTTVVDFTTDLNAIVAAINGLSLNPSPHSNVAEGILDIGKAIERDRPARPVVVVVAVSGGQAGGASSNEVLNQLRQSAAVMHAVTIAGSQSASNLGTLGDESNREQVIGDGAKQSGGRRVEVTATVAVPKALQQIAGDLSAQYMIQYALPEGVKPSRNVNVSLKRRGVNLRAPSAVPDR